MNKSKLMISLLLMVSMMLLITPPANSQIGTYTFHGAPGDQKILIVKTSNNQSMEDLFGPIISTVDSYSGCTVLEEDLPTIKIPSNTKYVVC